MLHRKGVITLAALSALTLAGFANGSDSSDPHQLFPDRPMFMDDVPSTAPSTAPASAPAAADKPLMALLDQTPVGASLKAMNINLYGYFEAGYTASASAPPRNNISGNVFNSRNERIVVDQVDFTIERTVDPAAAAKLHSFDVGGRFEIIYGQDTGLFHSNGLYDNPLSTTRSHPYYGGRFDPENQFDINQAYLDFALPLGNGLDLKVGKFVTTLGYEVINPTGNALYSHSYLFGYAIPFTQTGILGTYVLNDQWTVDAGITRGWNQSVRDNNGDPDLLAGVTWAPNANDKFIVNLSMGPEAAHDNGDWWTVIDFQAMHKFSDKFNMALNADYGDAPHAIAPSSAQWYGAAVYGSYTLCDYATLNARGEWYDDNDGFTLGAGRAMQVYEATVGLAITPMPHNDIMKNLVIRPEVRYDYASARYFDGGTDHYQFQAAVDAYFAF